MTDQNAKAAARDFCKGLEDFKGTLEKVQKQDSLNEQDLKSLGQA